MESFLNYNPAKPRCFRQRGKVYDDNIYTFDIETTSLFYAEEVGEWTPWMSYYRECKHVDKHGTPYLWMFGENGKVYYGRDMVEEFTRVLLSLSDEEVTKIIYVHNLSWEFQFLRDIIKRQHWKVKWMVANAPRKPIAFIIEDINVMFRCSYKLTQLKLETCGPAYGLSARKQVGFLDYDKPRGIDTPLTEEELLYAEYDILVLDELIGVFRDKYKHIKTIPLTQTGEVKFGYRQVIPKDHIFKVRNDIPTLRFYKWCRNALLGGWVHGSVLYNNICQYDIDMWDIASSYPYSMCNMKAPYHMYYHWGKPSDKYMDREKYGIIYHIRLSNVKLKRVLSFLSVSKCYKVSLGYSSDNGRLVAADSVELFLTEIDFDLFNQFYNYEKIEYIDYYVGKKRRLPKYFIVYLLEQYNNKTKLKGVKSTPERDFEAEYQKGKQVCNCLYGVFLQNIVQSTIEFDGDDWMCPKITDEAIEYKLEELRNGWNSLFWYVHGLYVTAWSRERLCRALLKFDKYVVYGDTDSCKIQSTAPDAATWFQEENNRIRKINFQTAKDLGIDPDLFEPKDKNGVKHPLGFWEFEGCASEFKALKAKAYCFRLKPDEDIKVCISGVGRKHSSELITSMDKFNPNTVFNEYYAGKLEHTYIDDQSNIRFRDYLGELQDSTQEHGITLNPAEYHMSGVGIDEVILQNIQRKSFEHILTDGHFI